MENLENLELSGKMNNDKVREWSENWIVIEKSQEKTSFHKCLDVKFFIKLHHKILKTLSFRVAPDPIIKATFVIQLCSHD